MNDMVIVKAKKEDASIILDFIFSLAKYEKMEELVKTTVSDIKKHVFANKYAEVLLLKKTEKVIGFAVYYYKFSTFTGHPTLFLEDLYIIQQERGKGYGTKVLKYLAQLALEKECARFEWECLEWNKSSIKFYENIGAKAQNGWISFRMEEKELKEFIKKVD
jgi:RimJ/RimL family protein N-acetyltransferase